MRALVDHVVRGNLAAVHMLAGVPLSELARLDLARPDVDVLEGDPLAAWRRSDVAAVEAFARPGTFDVVIHHPSGDLPGSRFAVMRFTDNLVHGWDLARAIGADATLDPALVEAAHAFLAPVAHTLPASGYFGAAHEVAPAADRQTRLLALVGRTTAPA